MLKMLFLLLVFRIRPHLPLTGTVRSRFRVMPWDLDANIHMNNVQYLKYLEKARIDHLVQTPFFYAQHRQKVHGLIVNTEVSYLKSLLPFQAFTVDTRVASWDERYVYIDQRVESGGELYSVALVRLALLQAGKRVSPLEILARSQKGQPVPALPLSAMRLNELVAAQREETRSRTPVLESPSAAMADPQA